jgi:hypothetical protein
MTAPSDPPGGPPPERVPGRLLTSGRLTAVLAVLLVALVAVAVLPQLGLPRISIEWGDPTPGATQPPASAAPSPSAGGSPTFIRPTPTALPTFISYTVRPGDSLNSIATLFNTKARSIAWWNRGAHPNLDPESPTYNPGLIEVGWVLVLIPGTVVDEEHPPSPSPGRATPTAASTAGASTAPGASPAGSRAPGASP